MKATCITIGCILLLISVPLNTGRLVDYESFFSPRDCMSYAFDFENEADQTMIETSSKLTMLNNDEWWIQTVDSTGRSGRYTALDLDSKGYPHISYCREDSGGFVKYAHWNGMNWEIETIDTGSGGTYGNVTTTSIVVDPEDHPHLVYAKPPNHVKYAYWDGEKWSYDTIITKDGIYGSVDIALDAENHPHISYCDGYGKYHVRYAYFNGLTWSNEVVDESCRGGIHNTICLDSCDNPCIAYSSVPMRRIKFACKSVDLTDNWNISIVDSSYSGYYFYPSLRLDSNDFPHIGYFDIESFTLKYAYFSGETSNWNVSNVVSDEKVGFSYSLALSSDNRPFLIFQELTEKNLCMISWHDGTWEKEIIDSDGLVGCCSKIVLDTNDLPCISYRDEEKGNLKFARMQPFSIKCMKPENAIYVNNNKLCRFPIPFVIGSIDITVLIENNEYIINHVDVFVDDVFQIKLLDEPYVYQWDTVCFGPYVIKMIATDEQGNQALKLVDVWKIF
ncbi:MAG: hypothetical protein KGY50_02735 [Candidatus Thermoplasmatota archaeon]|nr:hypothetical protein [Candidatus Thermoplasmatota archaeon]